MACSMARAGKRVADPLCSTSIILWKATLAHLCSQSCVYSNPSRFLCSLLVLMSCGREHVQYTLEKLLRSYPQVRALHGAHASRLTKQAGHKVGAHAPGEEGSAKRGAQQSQQGLQILACMLIQGRQAISHLCQLQSFTGKSQRLHFMPCSCAGFKQQGIIRQQIAALFANFPETTLTLQN